MPQNIVESENIKLNISVFNSRIIFSYFGCHDLFITHSFKFQIHAKDIDSKAAESSELNLSKQRKYIYICIY